MQSFLENMQKYEETVKTDPLKHQKQAETPPSLPGPIHFSGPAGFIQCDYFYDIHLQSL